MADCDGSQLWYERSGSGERLLYCNGSGSTLASARTVLDILGGSFDVVGFDYRGMGQSPPASDGYTMSDVADDVEALLDHLGWNSCRLAGLSFGGMVAQEFAVTRPHRVERLALLSTSPGGEFSSYPLEQLSDLPDQERAERLLLLTDRRWTTEWLGAHPADLQIVLSLAEGRSPAPTAEQQRGLDAQLTARRGHDVLDRLGLVAAPTFVGCGRHDDIAPLANSEAIVDRVPDARLHVYEGGHLFLFQDPAAWPDVLGFLTGA